MANPTAPNEGDGRRIPFLVDPASSTNPRLVRGRGELGTTDTKIASTTVDHGVLGATGHKDVAVSGTAVALSTTHACLYVRIKADADNTDPIYVGISTVTNDNTAGTGGYHLDKGESIDVPVDDIANVYINGTANDGVSFMRID